MKREGKVEPKGNAVKRGPTTGLEKVAAEVEEEQQNTEMRTSLIEKHAVSRLRDEVTS
jgi:hypothetical protein